MENLNMNKKLFSWAKKENHKNTLTLKDHEMKMVFTVV